MARSGMELILTEYLVTPETIHFVHLETQKSDFSPTLFQLSPTLFQLDGVTGKKLDDV